MRVLLSIKPEFAELIFSGKKKYEYRKQIFKKDIDTIVVYASSPVQKVIGEFSIEQIYHNEVLKLWEETKEHSGITYDYYNEYFCNHENGYAIKVHNTKKYHIPFDLNKIYSSAPPQSFAYIQ
jgi:predicted transcriptional regulator